IADTLVSADAIEDEANPGIEAFRRPEVVGIGIESLRGKADTDDALGGAPAAAPKAARLPGETQMKFSRVCLPGARALRAPDLDHARQFGVKGRAPVETIAAEIHHAPAPPEVGL